MSEQPINVDVLGRIVLAAAQEPRLSATFPGITLENAAFEALSLVSAGEDANDLIEDVLAVAAVTISALIRASHNGELCPGCMARSVFGYSMEVAAVIGADDAANEPDEDPSETPPFSGSIN
jgi:hypothetical protein